MNNKEFPVLDTIARDVSDSEIYYQGIKELESRNLYE